MHHLVETLETQALYDELVLFGCADRAAKILDSQCCTGITASFAFWCHFLQFLDLSAAQLGDLGRLLQSLQTIECGFDHIMRVGGTD